MPDARVPELRLPLVICLPPRWPTPSTEWVISHLGWQPPHDWVPFLGCPVMPPGWELWKRNGAVWRTLSHERLRPARRTIWGGLAALMGGIVLTIVGLVVPGTELQLFLIAAAAGLFGAGRVFTGMGRFRTATAAVMEGIRAHALQIKTDSDKRAYQNYLRSSGQRP